MEKKEIYTLEELYNSLEISMVQFSKRAKITEGTLARIKRGYAARRATVNRLLRAFAEEYGVALSLENVRGIRLEEKNEPENTTIAHAQALTTDYTPSITQPQNKLSTRKRGTSTRDLPEGCILARDFAKAHGVPPMTFRDHIVIGLGRGEKEKVEVSERPKAGRPHETERYLTPDQQEKALSFWQRYHVKCHQ